MTSEKRMLKEIEELKTENKILKARLDETDAKLCKALILCSKKNEENEWIKNHYADAFKSARDEAKRSSQLFGDYYDTLTASGYEYKHAKEYK